MEGAGWLNYASMITNLMYREVIVVNNKEGSVECSTTSPRIYNRNTYVSMSASRQRYPASQQATLHVIIIPGVAQMCKLVFGTPGSTENEIEQF